jgi:hypothetical protein
MSQRYSPYAPRKIPTSGGRCGSGDKAAQRAEKPEKEKRPEPGWTEVKRKSTLRGPCTKMKIVAGVLLFGTLVMEGSKGGFPAMGTKKKEEETGRKCLEA